MEEKGLYPLPIPPEDAVHPQGQANERAAFVEKGPELPEAYEVDLVRLLVQDPWRVYIFWEVSQEGLEGARKRARRFGLGEGEIALHITNMTTQSTAVLKVGEAREWWLLAEPGTDYRAEIGLAVGDHFFTIAGGNRVRTPAAGIAAEAAEEAASSAPKIAEVLRASGYTVATVEDIQRGTQTLREEPVPTHRQEHPLLRLLPPDIRAVVLERRPDAPPEVLRRIVIAAPRFVLSGSERDHHLRMLIEMLNWPVRPVEWPSSRP